MNVLLLSTGGGGGNILRSVKTLFQRDVSATEKVDQEYAQRLRAAVSTCFLDTNEFSLSDVPAGERLLIGDRTTGRLGARHNPEVAREALEESRSDVEALISRYPVIVLVGTGGKGTGAGTLFPLAQIARQQRKLVIPVFVRPSFERHEVDKRRYDHALHVSEQFDAAGIRFVEILNDRGYDDREPRPQLAVWEQMNRPIAKALRGLIYVLWDLSQVDPSDLSALFGGFGRLRFGFGEVAPSEGGDPDRDQVEAAIQQCWDNPFCSFTKPAGTSLICIQGDWSNVVDANIKGGLAVRAMSSKTDSPYNPLYMRAARSPQPWGVTAVFSEHTGSHAPLAIDWRFEERAPAPATVATGIADTIPVDAPVEAAVSSLALDEDEPAAGARDTGPGFASLWEFARGVDRSDPAALALALAADGAAPGFAVDGREVRKLLDRMWFRSVVPRLSDRWRERLLGALLATVTVPNHLVKAGRQPVRLSELSCDQLKDVLSRCSVEDDLRTDVDLLVTVGRLWGPGALDQVSYVDVDVPVPSRLSSLLHGLLS
jgi:cell division GTPase FtsZ